MKVEIVTFVVNIVKGSAKWKCCSPSCIQAQRDTSDQDNYQNLDY